MLVSFKRHHSLLVPTETVMLDNFCISVFQIRDTCNSQTSYYKYEEKSTKTLKKRKDLFWLIVLVSWAWCISRWEHVVESPLTLWC